MIDFSLQHILKDSPYDITLSEAGFIFQTDNGIHYHVSFDEEEIVLGGCKTYQCILYRVDTSAFRRGASRTDVRFLQQGQCQCRQ